MLYGKDRRHMAKMLGGRQKILIIPVKIRLKQKQQQQQTNEKQTGSNLASCFVCHFKSHLLFDRVMETVSVTVVGD